VKINAREKVIILHGLGRSPRSMNKINRELDIVGYETLNIGYPSHFLTFEEILKKLIQTIKPRVKESTQQDQTVHFVGHSFGGILIRGLLANKNLWLPENSKSLTSSRCVMIGTPNKGTSIANFMVSHFLLKHLTPKVSKELALNSELLQKLPEPIIETGIIAGNKAFTPLVPVTWFYKKASANAPGDGIVEISSTQCSVMSDFIVMPLHHSFMMWDSQLIKQSIHFLENGHFKH